ncbi:MAG: SDR family NAD(P)-dependent oxidoreductase, partial [Acidimicrobiales bacterium]
MPDWSAAAIPDLAGRVAIVTGANSGIGLETTRELAAAGASVIMACRDRGRGEAARQRLIDDHGDGDRTRVESLDLAVDELDLSRPASIESFAGHVIDDSTGIDLLINNAGVMACPPALTEQGVERQWATNHLGHFALTGLLLPSLTDGARVVTISSLAADGGDLSRPIMTNLDDYSRFQVYSDTKLANQVFAVELNHRLA